MFNSQLLDVAIGMAFTYLALSLICSGLNEWIAQHLDSRAHHLEAWLLRVLKGMNAAHEDLAQTFKEHPLIKALDREDKQPDATARGGLAGLMDRLVKAFSPKDKGPSYILPRTFLLALLDTIAPIDRAAPNRTIEDVRKAVNGLSDDDFKRTLIALLDSAGDDLEKVRQNIEGWFNDAMERLSGTYKRRTRVVLMALALGVTVGMNVDSLRIFSALYHDVPLRAAVVAAAEQAAQQPGSAGQAPALPDLQRYRNALEELGLPIGWTDATLPGPDEPGGWGLMFVGWLITALAISQGAPFWFDTMNKLVNVRTTGARPPTTPTAAPAEARIVVQASAPTGESAAERSRLSYDG